MTYVSPTTKEEYEAAFQVNTEYSGSGTTTRMTVPCPFCAAPKFMSWSVWPTREDNIEAVMSAGATCSSCARACRAEFTRTAGGVRFDMVQTAGEPPPPWVEAMRIGSSVEAVAGPKRG